jgi:CheY-like chemotaxis protein
MAKRVLIIDDDQTIVKFLSVALSEHGYEPLSANDCNEGLQKVTQTKPDLIVLDVMMPGKSGFVMIKQLKKDDELKDIPVLMLSGISDVLDEWEDHKDETAESPYDALRATLKKKIHEMREDGLLSPEMFLEKPVKTDAFIGKVRELIGS